MTSATHRAIQALTTGHLEIDGTDHDWMDQ